MARYIDADKLSEMIQHKADTLIAGKETFLYVAKWLELLPGADVVARSECEKWYHEYHVIKDALKQEKEYHRSTEKLADKYQLELEAMRGAANSIKMHYEKAKQEADRLAVELEAEKTLRVVRIERIFEEIEMLMKRHIFPVVREGVIEIEREPFLVIDPKDWAVFKNMFIYGGQSGTPVPTGEDEGAASSDSDISIPPEIVEMMSKGIIKGITDKITLMNWLSEEGSDGER